MEFDDEMHVWEFPPVSTYLEAAPEFKKKLAEEVILRKGSMQTAANFLNQMSVRYGIQSRYGANNICDWKNGRMKNGERKQTLIPLWVVLEMIDATSNSEKEKYARLNSFEKYVISYRELERGTPVLADKLPIMINPEFDSIIFHLMGDGCWGGKGKLSSYRQKDKIGRDNFISKIRNVFGWFKVDEYESEMELKVCIPRVIAKIIEEHYDLKSASEKKRVPPQIMSKGKKNKLAGLVGFIVDEGHIGDAIEIYQSNKELLEDLRLICKELGYKCSDVVLKAKAGEQKHKADHYRLRISLNASEKLYADIKELTKEYPTCGLAQKQESLDTIVKRRAMKKGKGQNGITKAKIAEILQKGPATVKHLKKELFIGGQTICEHLNQMETEKQVEKFGKAKNSIVWILARNQSISSVKASCFLEDSSTAEEQAVLQAR